MQAPPIEGLCILSDWFNPEAKRLELAYWVLLGHAHKPFKYRAMRLLPGAQQGPISVITLEPQQVRYAQPWEPRRDYYAIQSAANTHGPA